MDITEQYTQLLQDLKQAKSPQQVFGFAGSFLFTHTPLLAFGIIQQNDGSPTLSFYANKQQAPNTIPSDRSLQETLLRWCTIHLKDNTSCFINSQNFIWHSLPELNNNKGLVFKFETADQAKTNTPTLAMVVAASSLALSAIRAMLPNTKSVIMELVADLLPGILHEINSPLGAIQASTECIKIASIDQEQTLFQLCNDLNEQEFIKFKKLLSRKQESNRLSYLDRKKACAALTKELNCLNIDTTHKLIAKLQSIGVTNIKEEILFLLLKPDWAKHLAVISNIQKQHIAIPALTNAISRIRNTSSVLREILTFHTSQYQPISLAETCELALQLLQNKIKNTVEVDLATLPFVELKCKNDELFIIALINILLALEASNFLGKLDIWGTLTDKSIDLHIETTNQGSKNEQALRAAHIAIADAYCYNINAETVRIKTELGLHIAITIPTGNPPH